MKKVKIELSDRRDPKTGWRVLFCKLCTETVVELTWNADAKVIAWFKVEGAKAHKCGERPETEIEVSADIAEANKLLMKKFGAQFKLKSRRIK